MATLEKISNKSWKHPFANRKGINTWTVQSDVADSCGISDGQDRCFRIKADEQFSFRVEFTGSFHISSGNEIYLPADLCKIIKPIIEKNESSFLVFEVLD